MRSGGLKAAFQPPSDMTAGSGGGGNRKIFTVLGVGCGLVLLAIGLVLAFGGFKVAKCCDDAQGVALRVQAVQNFGETFVKKMQTGDADGVFADLSDDYQNQMPLEAVKKLLADHKPGLESGEAVNINTQANNENANIDSFSDIKNFSVAYQVMNSSDKNSLVIDFDVVTVGEGDDAKFKVEDIQFGVKERILSNEPPAIEVVEFHQTLQSGNTAFAYGRLSNVFKGETDLAAFEKFLEETGEILTNSTLEVRSVDYSPSGATVMAHARTSSGQNAIVQFELVSIEIAAVKGFQIAAIAPTIAEDAPDVVPQSETNNGSNNGSTNNAD